jgi:type IV fimbrial biogenesis protein FimT
MDTEPTTACVRARKAAAGARRSRGLTMIELLTGLALLAIVLSMAAPDFQSFGRSTRAMTQAADLQSAFAYARSESARRGVRVTVCRSSNPLAAVPACDDEAAWTGGWLAFVDNVQVTGNDPGVVDGTDTVLRIGEPAPGGTITSTGALGPWVTFSPQGLARTDSGPVNGSLLVCQSPSGRRISLNAVGLVSMTEEAC